MPRSDLRIFTCSVYPDLTRVWYQVLMRTFDGTPPDTRIFDCGGDLREADFPGATIRRIPNWDHGRKIDLALTQFAGETPVLVIDDDAFLLERGIVDRGLTALAREPQAAVYTFLCRDWWQLPAAGRLHVPMGSYAFLVRPGVIRREGLSFRTVPTTDPAIRKGSGYWDTADHAQKELIERGYSILYAPSTDREALPTFFGTSGAYLSFTRRALLSRRRVRRWNWTRTTRAITAERYAFQRACSITAAIDLHTVLCSSEPRFRDWYDEPGVRAQARAIPDAALAAECAEAATRIFAIRSRVLGVAPVAVSA